MRQGAGGRSSRAQRGDGAPMTDLAQRLRDKANDLYNTRGETMKRWDEIRQQCAKNDGSDLPRLMFEQIIDDHADLMIEAADAVLAGGTAGSALQWIADQHDCDPGTISAADLCLVARNAIRKPAA